jgi:hypothetical protein
VRTYVLVIDEIMKIEANRQESIERAREDHKRNKLKRLKIIV